MDSITDLVRLAQAGDSAAFDELYTRTLKRVRGTVRKFLKDRHDIDDIVQETYLYAFRGLHRFDLDRAVPFAGFLCRIAANRAQSLCKWRRLRQLYSSIDFFYYAQDPRAPDPFDRASRSLRRDEMLRALSRLDPHHRELLVDNVQQSREDLARSRGRSVRAITQALVYARRLLRQQLPPEQPGA